ncbi:MAG TPA: putative baseplate assembly protein [Burkholderiales bacterium]|nr:putative baseplate assembly protein [Burkholderiales bacterium]
MKGIDTNLKVNDALLIDHGDGEPKPYRVLTIAPDPKLGQTLVTFADWGVPSGAAGKALGLGKGGAEIDPAIGVIGKLTLAPSQPPRNALTVTRDLKSTFTKKADIAAQVVATFQPVLQDTFSTALANAPASASNSIHVYALRAKARLFGSNLPGQPNYQRDAIGMISISSYTEPTINDTFGLNGSIEALTVVPLDAEYERIKSTGWVAIERPPIVSAPVITIARAAGATPSGRVITVHSVTDARSTTLAASGVATKSTQLTIDPAWLSDLDDLEDALNSSAVLRGTSVYAQSEELPLADEPIVADICGGNNSWIELDGLYSELKSGRWVIVSGERADVTVDDPNNPGTSIPVRGIHASELVMLSNVVQDVALSGGIAQSLFQPQAKGRRPLPDERKHTFLQFAKDLQYCYARDKVTIYGNVVKATHGETRNEALGNGDGAKGLQSFTLKQPPLTFVAAPTAVGADSTLHAYVNDVEWHEADALAFLRAKDRGFVTSTDDAGNTTLIFGNGEHGARLPTGSMNVNAKYRNGIGNAGNVRAEQISLLQTRPLGVKAVINPLRASGGADKEGRDLARENAPLSVMPLDRLVSVRDYADFTRRFAGIAKALATKSSDGHRELIYLTIAGVDDAPIDASSDLYRNLLEALRDLGDPDLPLRIELRELRMLVLSAKIKLLADYQWEPVVTAVRAQLLDTFGFGKRSLGQAVLLSEVISAVQRARGVAYVDIDAFGAVSEKVAGILADGTVGRRLQTPDEIVAAVQFVIDPAEVLRISFSRAARDRLPRNVDVWVGGSDAGVLRPAELAIFAPAVPDTLILNQIP